MSVIQILPLFRRWLCSSSRSMYLSGIWFAARRIFFFGESAWQCLGWEVLPRPTFLFPGVAAVFVSWFLFGAILNPAWIGQGTLYLLVRKSWVHIVSAVLILASLVSTGLMLSATINDGGFQLGTPISQQYKAIISPAWLNVLLIPTILFGTTGLILLVGGALYSAFLFWRKRVLPNRVLGNVLIAAGALSVGSASELTHLGYGQFLYVGELIAAVLMYFGFRLAAQPQPDEVPQPTVAVPAN